MKIRNFIIKQRFTIIGLIVGTIAGFLYWQFIGCESGTCSITSSPLNSSVYGALIGGLLGNSFVSKTNKSDK